MGWAHSSSFFPMSALRDNEGPQKYLWDETMMCFQKQNFFKMEKLRGLCGFSKVAAQEVAEKQITVLEFIVTFYNHIIRQEWYTHNSKPHIKWNVSGSFPASYLETDPIYDF